MRQLLSLLMISFLSACGAPQGADSASAPSASAPSASAPSANVSAANAPSYELFTWLDPNEASRRCSFAIVPAVSGERKDVQLGELAGRVRAGAVVGLDGLEARLKALPEGSRLFWSDALFFMSSLQFGLPKSARIEQVRRIAAERRFNLSFWESLNPDKPGFTLPCVD